MKCVPQPLRCAVLALGLIGVACAASITYQLNVPDPPSAPAPLDPSKTLAVFGVVPTTPTLLFPQFDPALGTLTSVDFAGTANYYYDDFVSNISGTSIDVRLAPILSMWVTDPAQVGFGMNDPPAEVGYFILPGHTIELTGNSSPSGFSHWNIANLTTNYVGTGTVPLILHAINAMDEATGTGDLRQISDAPNGSFNANISVTYNYTAAASLAAPEPGSFLLLGGSLFAVGFLRRRGRSQLCRRTE